MIDVIIIGAGVIGASIARALSKYKLKVVVLEKNNDVGDETSKANSAIVHSGYDPHVGTLKAFHNVRGNQMFKNLCEELDVDFKQIGSLTIATTLEEVETLEKLRENGLKNGVETEIIDKQRLLEIEPFATKKAIKALYAKTCGIVNPFELTVALMENAIDNGVTLKLNEKVINIIKNDTFTVITNENTYESKIVINCAGVNSDEISNMICDEKEQILPRKGEYYVLDHFLDKYVTHTLFSPPSDKGKGILISPTTSGNYLIGPSSEFTLDKDDKDTDKATLNNVIKEAYRLVDNIPFEHVIRQFSGVRSYHKQNDFIIKTKDNFINLIGIQSPGLASSPSIALSVSEMVGKIIKLEEKETYIKRRKVIRFNKLSIEEKNNLIKQDKNYGIIVCRCEKITLGEIIDCIKRSCGAKTVQGVKKRCRPGFGKCQGGFCEPLVVKALADNLNIDMLDVLYGNKNTNVFSLETKVNK